MESADEVPDALTRGVEVTSPQGFEVDRAAVAAVADEYGPGRAGVGGQVRGRLEGESRWPSAGRS